MDLNIFSQAIQSFTDEPWLQELTLYKDQKLSVYYSPFEYINTGAKVVLCGITPGRTQAITANRIARDKLKAGCTILEAQSAAKCAASFDKLRNNLSAMLDEIGVNQWLKMESCSQLFADKAEMVHYTSAIRYPVVMANGDGYNGTPQPQSHNFLRHLLDSCLAEEARVLSDCLWIPLGKGAAVAMDYLVAQGILASDRILQGVPHPSGANAERVAYFLGRKPKSQLSSKTDAGKLDRTKDQLIQQVAGLSRSRG